MSEDAEFECAKHRFKKQLEKNIDRVLDEELKDFKDGTRKPTYSIMNFVRGLYYLTIAKFTNPVSYEIAWKMVDKLSEPGYSATTDIASSTTVSPSESGIDGKTGSE
jgi:hypothetical protein